MTNSGPHQSDMGKREFRQILTASFRASGQVSGAPSSVSDQDFARISAPISPPPARKWGKAIMPLLPASSASRYRSDIEATVRFAEETYADKVFEQHLVRRHVYLPEPICLCERHPQSRHLEVFPSNTSDKRFRRRRFASAFSCCRH